MWLDTYLMDAPSFEEDLEASWEKIKPLYTKIHAYARHKLMEQWSDYDKSSDDPIPAHLLGDMMAQSWENIENILRPYHTNDTGGPVDLLEAIREEVNEALVQKEKVF